MNRRDIILIEVDDVIGNFLYYDRKEDEELPRGSIEEAIEKGEISLDEIKAQFCRILDSKISR